MGTKQTYWICTGLENLEFLESVGVTVGERRGNYWYGCTIPDEALDDLFEVWGMGSGDTVMFALESVDSRVPRDWGHSGVVGGRGLPHPGKTKQFCSKCSSLLRENGTCSLPLCGAGLYDHRGVTYDRGGVREPGRAKARLRQSVE